MPHGSTKFATWNARPFQSRTTRAWRTAGGTIARCRVAFLRRFLKRSGTSYSWTARRASRGTPPADSKASFSLPNWPAWGRRSFFTTMTVGRKMLSRRGTWARLTKFMAGCRRWLFFGPSVHWPSRERRNSLQYNNFPHIRSPIYPLDVARGGGKIGWFPWQALPITNPCRFSPALVNCAFPLSRTGSGCCLLGPVKPHFGRPRGGR